MFFRISPLRHTNRCRAVIFHGVRFDSTATQRIKRRWRSGKRCARRPWSLSHIFDLRSSRSMKQIEGTITGAILRCLDCSSDSEQCTLPLQSTLGVQHYCKEFRCVMNIWIQSCIWGKRSRNMHAYSRSTMKDTNAQFWSLFRSSFFSVKKSIIIITSKKRGVGEKLATLER